MSIRTSELPTKEHLEGFFFEGMCATGWASPNPKITPHPDLTWWGKTTYSRPFGAHTLSLVDTWGEGKGVTTITLLFDSDAFMVVPRMTLWVMRYEHAVIFSQNSLRNLRRILNDAYLERGFYGGRGKTSHDRRTHYWNEWGGNFSQFSGKEEMWIRSESKADSLFVLAGNTTYRGGCLY